LRSIYAKILLWFFGTVLLTLIGLGVISRFVVSDMVASNSGFGRLNGLQLEEARETYESQGRVGLAAYFDRVDRILGGERYFTNAQGIDLLNGEDHSALLQTLGPKWGVPRPALGHMTVAVASEDNRYRLIAIVDPPIQPGIYLPYYLPVLAVVALLCWILARRIAAPLHDLVGAVDRFGHGELSVRVNSRRRDEFGELGNAFDRMAARIGTLLTAERQLLQDISHELRSPLARLSFAAELARTADDRDAAAQRLKKEIHRLTNLVDELLQATRAEGDPLPMALENIRLNDVLTEVVEVCRVEADAHGCFIALEGEQRVITMPGNRELLRRAIENIMRNAIRYTPHASVIDVRLSANSHTACISVRDYGPGVPEAALTDIFRPFFRVDDSRNNATGGVGLGLAIAQRAITLHHGHLSAANMHPGLTVTVEFPALTGVA